MKCADPGRDVSLVGVMYRPRRRAPQVLEPETPRIRHDDWHRGSARARSVNTSGCAHDPRKWHRRIQSAPRVLHLVGAAARAARTARRHRRSATAARSSSSPLSPSRSLLDRSDRSGRPAGKGLRCRRSRGFRATNDGPSPSRRRSSSRIPSGSRRGLRSAPGPACAHRPTPPPRARVKRRATGLPDGVERSRSASATPRDSRQRDLERALFAASRPRTTPSTDAA